LALNRRPQRKIVIKSLAPDSIAAIEIALDKAAPRFTGRDPCNG
jgi:hypothetical protein